MLFIGFSTNNTAFKISAETSSVSSIPFLSSLTLFALISNPITGFPQKYVIGISTSYANDFYTFGKKIQFSNGNYGFIERSGGKISGITTTNVGIGYSDGLYSNVPLFTVNGFGPNVYGASADLTFSGGKLSKTVIVTSGSGYSKGDFFFIASYTAGLRVLDISKIGIKEITEFGFFDTYPQDNNAKFDGVWNVYPYFESGVIAINDINSGLFLVKASE